MTGFKLLLAFGAGALFGTLLTKKIMVDKYEEMLDEEIDNVKTFYEKEAETYKEKFDQSESKDKVEEIRPAILYKRYHATKEAQEIHPGESNLSTPYIITPEQYDETMYTQDKITLTYYNGDGVLAGDDDERVELSCIGGEEVLGHFGEYHDDTVYVRNERLGTDYEIVFSESSYSDMVSDPIND